MKWTGEISGIADPKQNPVAFVMGTDAVDHNRHVTARFDRADARYGISSVVQPTDGGSVRLQPTQPPGGYVVNQEVELYAAQAGYVFSHWVGDLGGKDNPSSIVVSENLAITAIFNPTVTIYCSPSEGGSVVLQPESSDGYMAGAIVTISAKSARGYRFIAWEGDAAGSNRLTTITVDRAKTITARFEAQSASRWWLWVVIGIVGLFGVLVLLRLAYARMNRGAWDEP